MQHSEEVQRAVAHGRGLLPGYVSQACGHLLQQQGSHDRARCPGNKLGETGPGKRHFGRGKEGWGECGGSEVVGGIGAGQGAEPGVDQEQEGGEWGLCAHEQQPCFLCKGLLFFRLGWRGWGGVDIEQTIAELLADFAYSI